ncbi:MAG: hypothetical protein ACKPBG_05345, partial [Actinomycetota bacterium]
VTVMTPDQKSDVDSLTRKAGIKPRHTKVKPGDAIIVDLTGPVSPKRMRPVTQPQQQSSRPRTQSGRRPGPGNGQRTGSGNGQRSGSGNGQRAGARGGRRPGADNGPRGPRSSSGQRQQSRHR